MSLVLLVLCGAVAVCLWFPTLSDLLTLFHGRRPPGPVTVSLPRLVFLVPAHNESALIGECVRSLAGMDYPSSHRRVIVIADNCTDQTAQLAREAGGEAFERHDAEHPGKPPALAWALAQLNLDDFEACVIIDGDSTVDRQFARALAGAGPIEGIAVQAYFGTLNEWDSWLTRLAGVLARSRYEISYPHKRRAGLNCPLTGNGMCLGRELLRGGWRWFSLTENWELYAELTAHRITIEYASEALLYSHEAGTMRQGGTQRRRWLAGRLGVLRQWGPKILRSPKLPWNQKLDALVELGGPSPVLHLVLASAVAAVSLRLAGPAGSWIAGLAIGSLAGLVLTTLAVILHHPQPGRTIAAFVMLPLYAIWRSLTAVRTLLTLGDTVWRKTSR